jgi:heptosyltransferase-3
LKKIPALKSELDDLIDPKKFNVILHPKSKGSAKEWGLANYLQLIKLLPKDQFKIFISGTAEDGKLIGNTFDFDENVVSLIGKLSLTDFIAFIAKTDGLVAASTGPLHIAAALNKKAIGLYAPKRPDSSRQMETCGKTCSSRSF